MAALAPHPLLAALRQAYALGVRTGPLSPDELRAADAVLAPAERKARGDRKQRIRSARERLARLLAANPVPETDRSGPAA